jgi:branched-chain amino acid transport system permease protein
VRDDEVAAALCGMRVAGWQVLAFVVSACCAGLAGALLALNSTVVGGETGSFPLSLSLALLTGVVVGGLGSLTGAVWGAILLTFEMEWTQDFANKVHASANVVNNLPNAVYGLILIVVILGAPGGIQGLLRRLGGPLRRIRVSRPPLTIPIDPGGSA